MRIIKAGATSQTIYVEILDSTSTTGARKTGLAYNTSSLTAYYVRTGGSATAITLATLAAANSAYSSGGFKEVDATNMPGIYRLDLPDAAVAASAANCVVTLKGATGMVQVSVDIQLVAVDPQDSVRLGMTALPNAAAEAAGGLFTRGSGAGQINQPANGLIDANVTRFGGTAGTFSGGRPEVNTSHIAGSAVSTSSAQIGVNVVNAGGTAWGSGAITAGSIASNAITSAKIATDAIGAAQIADNAIDAGAIATDAITAAKIADGAIDLATFAADAKALFGVIAFGTAQSVTGTTIRLASAETFADDELIGATVLIRSATTGAGQSRVITDYVSATDTATVDTWTTTPTGTITYVVFGTAPASTSAPIAANVTQWLGTACATPTVAGVPEVDVTHNGGTAITAAAGIQEVKVASIAANAITAAATAADFGAEIADAVWDEATSGHTTAGTTGKALTDASSAGDPWSTSVPGAYSAGTAGYILGNNLNAPVGTVDTVVDAIKAKTDNLPASPAATGDAMTLTSAYDFAKGTAAMTESYATDGAAMTPAQALHQIWSLLSEKSIATTTLTAKKLDGTTTAMTFTLNDATNPTAITRAS